MSIVVGVIGGMGPAATADFFRLLVEATPAKRDQDHLHVLIDNNPGVPDRQDALLRGGPSPAPALAAAAQRLVAMGAELLVMPCNTAHAWSQSVREAVRTPFLSIIDATLQETRDRHPDVARVGVLATTGCLVAGLYQNALSASGIECLVLPAELQHRFSGLIAGMKGSGADDSARHEMVGLAEALATAGAEVLIAGCTEVPLLIEGAETPVPLVSSTHALARRTVSIALTG